MKNKTLQIAKTVIVLGSLFGFVAVASAAWTLPPAGTVAPANNVEAPVNISATGQNKTGALGVIGLSNTGTTRLYHKLDISDTTPATTGFFATYPDHFYSKFPALFDSTVGIRGVLGFTQAGGGLVTPTTGGTYNRPLVQGVDVCLANGANCPSSSGLSFPINTNPSPTAQGAWIGWNALSGGGGETDFINNQGSGGGGFLFQNTPSSGSPRTNLMFLTGAGNLGIGTTGPTQKLSVIGGAIYTNNNLYADGQGIITGGLRVGAGGAPSTTLTVNGNSDISGNLTVGGQNVCRQDGTNCPSGTQMYEVAVPSSGTASGAAAICGQLGPGTSLSGPWLATILPTSIGDSTFSPIPYGTLTKYQYCRSRGGTGNAVWANNPVGHLIP